MNPNPPTIQLSETRTREREEEELSSTKPMMRDVTRYFTAAHALSGFLISI